MSIASTGHSQSLSDPLTECEAMLAVGFPDSAAGILQTALMNLPEKAGVESTQLARLYRIGETLEGWEHEDGYRAAYQLAARSMQRTWGLGPAETADSLHKLGESVFRAGHYRRAETICYEALALWKDLGDPRAKDVHMSLGNILGQFGLFSEMDHHYRRAAEIATQAYGSDHYLTARALGGVAVFSLGTGKYALAEAQYRDILRILRDTLSEDDPAVYTSIINLGQATQARGKYSESDELYRQAITILERFNPPNPYGMAVVLESLADSYIERGRYDEASEHLHRALRMREDTFGPRHPWLENTLRPLAFVEVARGELEKADSLQSRILWMIDSAFGSGHTRVVRPLLDLSKTRLARGFAREAEAMCQRAFSIYANAFGAGHPMLAECYEKLSQCRAELGDMRQSVRDAAQGARLRHRGLRDFALVVSEQDALTQTMEMRWSTSEFLSRYLATARDSIFPEEEAANIILTGKGGIADAIFERRSVLSQLLDPETATLWEAYRHARFRQSQLYVSGPELGKEEEYKRTLDSLALVVVQRETALGQHMQATPGILAEGLVTCDQISKLLPENATLIEYLRYGHLDSDPSGDDHAYLALILGSNGHLKIVPIGSAEPIDELIDQYRRHFLRLSTQRRLPAKADEADYKRIAVQLYDRLWTPLADQLRGQDMILISPDGPLNWISFVTLVDPVRDEYLIERHTIHYLSAGRDIIRLQKVQSPASGLLAMGDPDFDSPDILSHAADSRGDLPSCRELQEISLPRLPRTRNEIDTVLAIWRRDHLEPAVGLLGSVATEDEFKSQARGRRVIHIATHGYSLFGLCETGNRAKRITEGGLYGPENPLLQSGLFLAGANPGRKQVVAPSEAEDGVLTAAEITATDLSGTELVVLSACETGLGAIQQGEGVYGLRRAFQMAGAQTVVSTLWRISDEHTAWMLPTIYSSGDEPLPSRLRLSQRKWIDRLHKAGVSGHPFSWGAFVATGDWR